MAVKQIVIRHYYVAAGISNYKERAPIRGVDHAARATPSLMLQAVDTQPILVSILGPHPTAHRFYRFRMHNGLLWLEAYSVIILALWLENHNANMQKC